MKYLLKELTQFFKDHSRLSFIIPLIVFLAAAYALNLKFDFKKTYLVYTAPGFQKNFLVFGFYYLPVIISFILYTLSFNKIHLLRNPRMYIMLALPVVLYTFSVTTTPWHLWVKSITVKTDRQFSHWICVFGFRTLLILIPVLLIWFYKARQDPTVFGLKPPESGLKKYIPLVAVIVVTIFFASFSPGLYKFYPMFFLKGQPDVCGMSYWTAFIIMELVYGLQFIGIELFFRGFFPAMLRDRLGDGAFFISSSMYFFIHFAKPPPEAITSFFGGLILCLIAARTRSIWSGIILHVTIAWSMDIFSLLQRLYFQS